MTDTERLARWLWPSARVSGISDAGAGGQRGMARPLFAAAGDDRDLDVCGGLGEFKVERGAITSRVTSTSTAMTIAPCKIAINRETHRIITVPLPLGLFPRQ